MSGVKVRALLTGVAAVAIGASLNGCGGQLVGHLGQGGSTDPAGHGGTTGVAGTFGRGGTAGTGSAFGEPACLSTVTKGGACTDFDQQLCYKTCGPEKTGVKSEACMGGIYTEMSGCSFDPSKDYSCYRISSAANTACPSVQTPMAASLCDVPHCTLCNSLQGAIGGQYFDASGAAKVGWCVCQAPNAAGERIWSCASDIAWPCPLGAGCTGPTGTGGNAGTGRGGAGGTVGTGGTGAGGTFGEPACLSTVVRSGPCTATDQQFCYKTCGPQAIGVKAETCTTAGTYAEMSGCSFDPSRDYSCYKIPATTNATCLPGVTPQASGACEVPPCTLCNSLAGAVGGQYLDVSGAPKVGWCVCQPPNASGVRTWNCANDTAWPCPLGSGC